MHIVIVGGGLAGLINAIRLSPYDCSISLIERKAYPFHRVCGEYISNEVLPFLSQLGYSPWQSGAVALTQFRLTSPRGQVLDMPLDLGGLGISRYQLDYDLYQLALQKGVRVYQKTQVQSIDTQKDKFVVHAGSVSLEADLVIGCFGKLSNLDHSLNRASFQQKSPYLGVKYHIRLPDKSFHPDDVIALHNFEQGYCGMSRIEQDRYCLCYLTTRQNLKKHHSIVALEQKVLQKNPFLKYIFQKATFLFDKPLVINEISFAPKQLVERGVLMCGDSAGMITPLCGNGMAMAIHGAKILSELVGLWIEGKINRSTLEQQYAQLWKLHFARRLWIGRQVQAFFGRVWLSEGLVWSFRKTKPLAHWLMSQTHGKPFV